MYGSEVTGVRRVGEPPKKWIDSEKKILRYYGVAGEQAKKIVYDRSTWCFFLKGLS